MRSMSVSRTFMAQIDERGRNPVHAVQAVRVALTDRTRCTGCTTSEGVEGESKQGLARCKTGARLGAP